MPTLSADRLWSGALERIQSSVNEQIYQTWFVPTRLIEFSEDSAILSVPNRFFGDWLRDHYQDLIEKTLSEITGAPTRVSFDIQKVDPLPDARVVAPAIPKRTQQSERPPQPPGLNPRYTFDSFVIGNNNRFSHAAALAVSDSPARAYNPLFIHGRVGMGKTHLMQAIAYQIASKNRSARIVYMSSEQFTNQLIGAIQNRSTHAFREKYRSADILLIDDIQFIAGKESTQEEFFHTFNALYDAHKQIVVSCDRSPKEIATMEERLVSRFEWGLITDIQPPDLETRTAILRKKSEKEKVFVPQEITNFIAKHIKSNIKELEGALIRVVAYSELTGTPITIDLTKELLKDALREEETRITIDLIQRKVADYFDIRFQDMVSKKRTRAIAHPRQIAMYLARELTDHSLPSIGDHFGGRDHATVLHAHEKIRLQARSKQSMRDLLTQLTGRMKG